MNDDGIVSLEAVWILPLFMLLGVGLLHVVGYARDVLVVHEAARAGVREAVVSHGATPVVVAATNAAFDRDITVTVDPPTRSAGDVVTVRVTAYRTVGPVTYPITATALGRVEPVVKQGAR